jgi:AAA+ ATPase superfamily predicted ATPase
VFSISSEVIVVFIGRERELQALNMRFQRGKFEFAVIYGRRRVGKTTLINEFIKDKPTIFYTGIEGNAKENLEGLSQSIYSFSMEGPSPSMSFSDYKAALEAAFEIAKRRRVVFVIDEFPYMAGGYKSISSLLQILIDSNKETSRMFLILCGSSLSFMENQVLGYKSPLFGRRTCQFKINPFTFFEFKDYFQKFSSVDMAVIYGITGGIPLYMSLMDDSLSLEDNIRNNFLDPNAYLFEEPTNLIKQECRDPSQYNSIIRAIAGGASKLSEISSKTGLETAHATSHLNKLIALGIVKKERPFGDSSARKTIYVIVDSMFRFWYRFIPDNTAVISRGLTDMAYASIEPHISTYMGGVFEEICKQYLWLLRERRTVPVEFSDLGRWWGNDPVKKEAVEIDIIGQSDKNTAVLAECKWTNDKVDVGVLNALAERSRLFRYTSAHLYLFAKTCFTTGCIEKAKSFGNVTLVPFNEMINSSHIN